MKKIILVIICLVIGTFVYQKEADIIIPSDAIRIRIIANSNNIRDLAAKNKLKNEIEQDIYNYVKTSKNVLEARESIKNNLEEIEKLVATKTDSFKINYGMNYFPRKEYKGVIYKAGEYESLVITLGSGMGDNWWCVLYPPLCLIEEDNNTSDVEYRSYIRDLIS